MSKNKTYMRFSVPRRIEHILLILSFSLLAITGLPQKYASSGISLFILQLFGGIETIRIVHRISATVFLLETVYHVVVMFYKLYVMRVKATMLPGIKDAQDGIESLLFNLGLRKDRPKMGRYNFTEKMEYWALVWGLVLMSLTGFMLWNPIATAKMLPGQFIPAAKAAHGAEAVLAVLAIFIWHFYNVHLKRWNWSMIKGTMSHEEMEEEHGLELEEIEKGEVVAKVDDKVYRKRMTIFIPISAVVSVVLLFGIYWFVTLEESSITTIPPVEQVAVFSPQTPTPVPTQPPAAKPTEKPASNAASLSWDGDIGPVFETKCSMCHGAAGGLSLADYGKAMKGMDAGPVILPGNADDSPVVNLMKAGGHPGAFDDAELAQVIEWINAGAPEK